MGCSLSGLGCSRVEYPLHRASGPARSLFQHRFPVTAYPGHINLLLCGDHHGLQLDLCSTMDLHELQGAVFLPMSYRSISGLALGASPPPPSSWTLVPAGLLLSLLSQLLMGSIFFSPSQKLISEELPQSLMGLALASRGPVLEPPGMGFVGHWGSFQQLLTEVTPVVPITTKTWLCKPNTQTHMAVSCRHSLLPLANFHTVQNLYRLFAQLEIYSVMWAWPFSQ